MSGIYLSLGSNLGDREATIEKALLEIDQLESTQITRVSSIYDTDPVEVQDQPRFLNVVIEIESDIGPHQLLWNLKLIERRLGRVRAKRWGPRVIDIDILLHGDRVVDEPELTLPHPALADRAFVLIPLSEMVPDLPHPVLGERISELMDRLSDADHGSVHKLGRLSY